MPGNKNDLFSVYRKKVIPSIHFKKIRVNLTLIFLYMRMGKEVFLAILHISVTLGAKPEFQIRIVQIRASAHRTFMLVKRSVRAAHLRRGCLRTKIALALDL